MTLETQIKLMSYDRLIDELHALHDMYFDFASNADNIMASSCFPMAVRTASGYPTNTATIKKAPA